MLFRLLVNICVSICVVCMDFMAINITLSSTRRMFWCPSSLSAIWVLLLGLCTRDLAMLHSLCPLEFLVGGMKEPFVYMHCCG